MGIVNAVNCCGINPVKEQKTSTQKIKTIKKDPLSHK